MSTLKIFCPSHQVVFDTENKPQIICEVVEHSLSNNFPKSEFWEYCCDCQTFTPSAFGMGGTAKKTCHYCDLLSVRRFLCDECKIIAYDSGAETKGKLHSINDADGIVPNCAGCHKAFAGFEIYQHNCSEIGSSFLTTRRDCPFCLKDILPQPKKIEQISGIDAPINHSEIQTVSTQCSKCGHWGKADRDFCGKCNNPIIDRISAETKEKPNPKTGTYAAFCINCGTENDSNSLFCVNCGYDLKTAADKTDQISSNGNASGQETPVNPVNSNLIYLAIIAGLSLFAFFAVWIAIKNNSDPATNNDSIQIYLSNSTTVTLTPNNNSSSSLQTSNGNVSRSNSSKVTSSEKVDSSVSKQEVNAALNDWKSAAEAHNLDSYMNSYADSIDYYKAKGWSRSRVRTDKQRAFSIFDRFQISLANISISIDPTGERAVAIMDKSWTFSGATKSSSGSVRQQMTFVKSGGRWLITGEKDLQVYSSRSY